MAARGPPSSLSIGGYPQGGGSGGSSDHFGARGRNRSAGSSGPSSREHSVEGRGGDNRRGLEVRGSGDFWASYHNQYQGPVYEQNRRTSGHNWGYGRDRGQNRDLYWRDDSRGIQGKVQGVLYDDNGPMGNGVSSARGYSLTIGSDGQGQRASTTQQRQENSYGGNRRQSNGYDRQENGHPGGQRQPNAHGGYERPGGYRRASQNGSYRGRAPSVEGRGAARVLPGRDLGVSKDFAFGDGRDLGASSSPNSLNRSKEVVFGGGRELETFGSPRKNLSRGINSLGSFLSPAADAKQHWAKNDVENGRDGTARGPTYGDVRRSLADESFGRGELWRSSSSTSSNGTKSGNRDTSQTPTRGSTTVKKEHNGNASTISGHESGSRYHRNNSIERMSDLSGELALPSPSSSSTKTFSRKNSNDRAKKQEVSDQLPVFSPSSEGKADMKRGTSSIDKLSRESFLKLSRESSRKLSRESSISESASRDVASDGHEGRNAVKQPPGTTSESASAGMHRTRSTDWYEICLKEEEEEELQALARKKEEESKLGRSQKPTQIEVRNFSKPSSSYEKLRESSVFSPSSITGGNYREAKNLEKGWSQERLVRGDTADSAQLNFARGQRNADAGGKEGLFTPWNALQTLPSSKTVSQSAPRSKPVEPPRDSLWKHENLRVSTTGGRQEAARGRRAVSAIDPDEAENWRAERRPSRDHSREVVARSDPRQEPLPGPSGRAMPKQTNGREGAGETEKTVPEVFLNKINGSIRPATFYRALHEAMAGDEDPLPHIVGTCPDMCPGKERAQRERLRDLAVFERVSGDMRKTSKDLAVKKFCRTVVASELECTDVRPLHVLWRTQQYLLGLLDDPEFSFDVVHNFLFDRTRAIRQELGMQCILDQQSITIHEEIVRFHILSEHELRNLNRKRSKQVDTHLNLQQLSKSLYSLLNLYISLGGKDGADFENEAEFHAYYVLLNLGNHGRFQAEPLSLWFPNVPPRVLDGAAMQFARKALRFYRSNNFIGFFRLVRNATYLQACLLELNFDSVRAMALAMLNVAEYKLHPYPVSDLAQQLILEEKEVDELCMYYGLLTGIENASQKLCLLAKQGQFSVPEKENLPQHSCPLVDGKRAPSFCQEVKGSKVI